MDVDNCLTLLCADLTTNCSHAWSKQTYFKVVVDFFQICFAGWIFPQLLKIQDCLIACRSFLLIASGRDPHPPNKMKREKASKFLKIIKQGGKDPIKSRLPQQKVENWIPSAVTLILIYIFLTTPQVKRIQDLSSKSLNLIYLFQKSRR